MQGFWSVLLCEAALVETAESASARHSKVSDVLSEAASPILLACARHDCCSRSHQPRLTTDCAPRAKTFVDLSSASPVNPAAVLWLACQDGSRSGQGRFHGRLVERPGGHRSQPVQQANDGSAQEQAAVSGCATKTCQSTVETRHYSCCRKSGALRGRSVGQLLLTKVSCY